MDQTWLLIAIVLYLIALIYALTVQRNAAASPDRADLDAAPARNAPGSATARAAGDGQKIRRGGMFLGTLIVVIVFLMVVKPTF